MIRAVLFDLDNTLIDRDRALRVSLKAEIQTRSAVDHLMALDNHGDGDRQQFLQQWSCIVAAPRTMTDLSHAICRQLVPDHHLNAVLQQLANHCAIGIVTNGGTDNQSRKWRRSGLDTVITKERLWISGSLDVAKPAAAIFMHACNNLNITPAQTLFVGDHWINDIVGARQAGLQALQVVRPVDTEFLFRLIELCQ